MKRLFTILFSVCMIFLFASCSSPSQGNGNGGNVPIYSDNRISITTGDTVLYANMYDNDTAREFMELLPFTLPTIERSGLAKGVHLPEYLGYDETALTREYSLGEIGYWPGGDIAIFYTDTLFEQTIVDVVQIGQIESGVDVFLHYSGSVTIERVQVSDKTYEVTSSELHASVNGADIYGVAYSPVGAGQNLPAVILSHGYGGRYSTNASYASELAKHGYFTYIFDFRGGAPGSNSDGITTEMSIFTEEEDLKAVVRMVQALPYVEEERIYLFGTSQGGLVSAMVAADMQEEIRGLVLLYPAFSLVSDATAMFPSAAEVPDTVHFLWMTVGKVYFEDLFGYDPYADAARYESDVLILHGDRDSIIPLSSSEQAVLEYSSATLRVISGAGHGFGSENETHVLSYTLGYLRAHH